MTYSYTEKKRIRKNFGTFAKVMDLPNLIETQLDSYSEFLQSEVSLEARKRQGLEDVFQSFNNGNTWNLIFSGPPIATFYAIEFFSNGDALICGSQGTMLKASALILNTNTVENSSLTIFYRSSIKELIVNSDLVFSSYLIYSLDGKLINEQKVTLNNTFKIDVSHLSNGNYMVVLNSDNNRRTAKFVKY